MRSKFPRDPNLAPKAHSTQWYLCPACTNLHVVLVGASGEVIATAVLSEAILLAMLKVIQGRASFGAMLTDTEH